MDPQKYFDGPAAFGMRVRHLLDTIELQISESLQLSGCKIPATTTGIVLLLFGTDDVSLADIAKRLKYSHQLATKRVGLLESEGYVRIESDPNDGRRRQVKLTKNGMRQGKKLVEYLGGLERAFNDVFDDIGMDALEVVLGVDAALSGQTLAARIYSQAERQIRQRSAYAK